MLWIATPFDVGIPPISAGNISERMNCIAIRVLLVGSRCRCATNTQPLRNSTFMERNTVLPQKGESDVYKFVVALWDEIKNPAKYCICGHSTNEHDDGRLCCGHSENFHNLVLYDCQKCDCREFGMSHPEMAEEKCICGHKYESHEIDNWCKRCDCKDYFVASTPPPAATAQGPIEDLVWKILNAPDQDDVRSYLMEASVWGVNLGREDGLREAATLFESTSCGDCGECERHISHTTNCPFTDPAQAIRGLLKRP